MLNLKKYSALLPIYSVIYMGYFGYALTTALFIPMLMDPGTHFLPPTATMGLRTALSGLLIAMYPLGQFLGSPIIGAFSDHFGRKKILLITLACAVAGYALIGASIYIHNLPILLISCLITGICESNMAIGQSVVADVTHDTAERGKLIGYMYSTCSLGYITGPLFGGFVVVNVGYAAPFFITTIGILLVMYCVHQFFNDKGEAHPEKPIRYLEAFTNLITIFTDNDIRRIYFINFLIFFAVMGSYRVVSMYMIDEWHTPVHMVSIMISYISFVCMLANLFLMAPLTARFPLKKLLMYLTAIGGLSILSIVIPKNFNWLWLTFGFTMIPTVLALSVCATWLSSSVERSRQGRALGNNQALFVLAESTAAIVGGSLAAIMIKLPTIATGVLLLVAALLIALYKPKKTSAAVNTTT